MPLHATAQQVPLFVEPPARRFDPVSEDEAAAFGRALLARVRGETLTAEQRALLDRARDGGEASDRRAPTPVVDVSETLLALPRGAQAELRVQVRRYKGSRPFLDIRRWERDGTGLKPTRQGVTFRMREVTQVLGAISQAARRMVAVGGE
ncbi:MAG: transcriptional coactivator p15/PC4 family protein [Sandaracinaceae bacterium]